MRSIFYALSAAAAVAVFCFLNSGAPIQSGSNFLQEIDPIDQVFIRYLAKEGKSYATKEEYERRKEYFAAQLKFVTEHNSRNGATYQVTMNSFSDLSKDEFQKYFTGDNGDAEVQTEEVEQVGTLQQSKVSPIDWRNMGVVGPVKNQAKCGSCWSFSTTGPIEEHYAIKYNRSVVLAEQQLVDCSWAYGNNGCNGGLYANGYAYVKQFGLMAEESYPYVANDTKCQYDASKVIVEITGTISAYRSADGLKQALMNGPASISLHASADSFRNYKSGVYNDATCPSEVNHAVQTVGWGHDDASNLDYFIMRNSWGPAWGDQGYMKIAVTNTNLGICGMLYRVPMQPIIV